MTRELAPPKRSVFILFVIFVAFTVPSDVSADGNVITYRPLAPNVVPFEMSNGRCQIEADEVAKSESDAYIERNKPGTGAGLTPGLAILGGLTLGLDARNVIRDAWNRRYDLCMKSNGWIRSN